MKRGNNALFDTLKLKSKGLDMLYYILQNNKSIVKTDNLNCMAMLDMLAKLSRNEKTLFDPMMRKYLIYI